SARKAEAVRQQEQRQAKVAGEVGSILAEVDRLEGEQKWPEALAVARRAAAAVAGGEADDETAQRVRQRLKDLEFIHRVGKVRRMGGEGGYYPRAFRDYGVDVVDLPVEESIQRLKARPALAIPLAAALDEWAFQSRDEWAFQSRGAPE